MPPNAPTPGDPRNGSLHDSEHLAEHLETLLSTLAAGVLETDAQGRLRYLNPAAMRTLGVTEQEILGKTVEELGIERYDESGQRIDPSRAPVMRAGRQREGTVRAVIRYVRPPAEQLWLESHTTPLRSATGELLGAVSSFIDVSDRYRLEAAKQASTDRMNEMLRAMAAGVLMVNAEGRIEYANTTAAALSGLTPEDVTGQLAADPAWKLTDEHGVVMRYDDLPVPTVLRERREVRDVYLGVPVPDGSMRWLRVSASPLFHGDGVLRGAVVTMEDITERRALAEQLLQAQKIEGVGQLAGGIAHDFNNLLTTIIGNADLALDTAERGSPMADDLAEIRDAALRGAALTRQLLTFARKQVVQPRALYVDRLAAGTEKLLHRVLGEQIALQRHSDADLWAVRVDPGQLEQVIVNMAINARDAMPGGGSLTLATRNVHIDEREARANPGVEPGEFVTLRVSDTGTGIARELLPRLFEPFFTTKPIGSGSGLGLSICHGVVKQARGFITVESLVGHGTTFVVHLPRTMDEVVETITALPTTVAAGGGTVLVVEDEDSVRALVSRTLGAYGFEVLSAGSGAEAIATLDRLAGPLDLLITDVVMPGMRGSEIARALRARLPTLPVLFMTGYPEFRNDDEHALDTEVNVLLKPFTPAQLVRRVQKLLADRL